LLYLGGFLEVERSTRVLSVILVLSHRHVLEDFVHLGYEVRVENCLTQPELFVFGKNNVMNAVRDLGNLARKKVLVDDEV